MLDFYREAIESFCPIVILAVAKLISEDRSRLDKRKKFSVISVNSSAAPQSGMQARAVKNP